MSNLTEEQIEELKETHPQKLLLRRIFLIVGLSLIVLGLVFLLFTVDFGITVDDINLSFVVDILIIVFGMILASKYFIAPYYLRENSLTYKGRDERELREPIEESIKFFSFPLTRLIASYHLIAVGILNFAVFGMGIGHHETRYGNAFVLGGPSFFYFTGLPALIIGLSLFLYVILSSFKGKFYKSKNFYFFYEFRPLSPWLTEVPKKDIEAVRYQNNHLGPKLAWIILFIPFIVMQLQTAIPLFSSQRAAPEHVFSWTLTITSIIEIIVLFILVMFPQNYYEMASKDMLYEMWFAPLRPRNQPKLTKEISEFLGTEVDEQSTKDPKKSELKDIKNEFERGNSLFGNISKTHFQLFDTVFGLFLFVTAIIMLTQMVLFGPLFWWVALMYGIMLLAKAFCYDFSTGDTEIFHYDSERKKFQFKRKFSYKFHYVTAKDVESIKVRKWFRKLDFFDIFGLGGMLVMLTVQQIEGWAIADTDIVIADNIVSTIYMAIIFIFIALYLLVPLDVVEFKTPSVTYRIRVTKKREKEGLKGLFSKYISNLKSFPKDARQEDMRKTFMIRLGIMLLLIAIASAYTIYSLISYFY